MRIRNLKCSIFKQKKSKVLNKEPSNIDSYNSVIHAIIDAIDTKNIDDIENFSNDINNNNKIDVNFELYNS